MSITSEIEEVIKQLTKAKVSDKNIKSALKINNKLVEMLLKKNASKNKTKTIEELFINSLKIND